MGVLKRTAEKLASIGEYDMKLKDRISARIPEEKRRPIRKALRAARVVKNIICWTMIVILSAHCKMKLQQ